jgi:hypothetical protein
MTNDTLEQLELLAVLCRSKGLEGVCFSVDSDGYFTAYFAGGKEVSYYNFDHAVKSINKLK